MSHRQPQHKVQQSLVNTYMSNVLASSKSKKKECLSSRSQLPHTRNTTKDTNYKSHMLTALPMETNQLRCTMFREYPMNVSQSRTCIYCPFEILSPSRCGTNPARTSKRRACVLPCYTSPLATQFMHEPDEEKLRDVYKRIMATMGHHAAIPQRICCVQMTKCR